MKQSQILAIAIKNLDMIGIGYEGPWIGIDDMSEEDLDKLEQMMEQQFTAKEKTVLDK